MRYLKSKKKFYIQDKKNRTKKKKIVRNLKGGMNSQNPSAEKKILASVRADVTTGIKITDNAKDLENLFKILLSKSQIGIPEWENRLANTDGTLVAKEVWTSYVNIEGKFDNHFFVPPVGWIIGSGVCVSFLMLWLFTESKKKNQSAQQKKLGIGDERNDEHYFQYLLGPIPSLGYTSTDIGIKEALLFDKNPPQCPNFFVINTAKMYTYKTRFSKNRLKKSAKKQGEVLEGGGVLWTNPKYNELFLCTYFGPSHYQEEVINPTKINHPEKDKIHKDKLYFSLPSPSIVEFYKNNMSNTQIVIPKSYKSIKTNIGEETNIGEVLDDLTLRINNIDKMNKWAKYPKQNIKDLIISGSISYHQEDSDEETGCGSGTIKFNGNCEIKSSAIATQLKSTPIEETYPPKKKAYLQKLLENGSDDNPYMAACNVSHTGRLFNSSRLPCTDTHFLKSEFNYFMKNNRTNHTIDTTKIMKSILAKYQYYSIANPYEFMDLLFTNNWHKFMLEYKLFLDKEYKQFLDRLDYIHNGDVAGTKLFEKKKSFNRLHTAKPPILYVDKKGNIISPWKSEGKKLILYCHNSMTAFGLSAEKFDENLSKIVENMHYFNNLMYIQQAAKDDFDKAGDKKDLVVSSGEKVQKINKDGNKSNEAKKIGSDKKFGKTGYRDSTKKSQFVRNRIELAKREGRFKATFEQVYGYIKCAIEVLGSIRIKIDKYCKIIEPLKYNISNNQKFGNIATDIIKWWCVPKNIYYGNTEQNMKKKLKQDWQKVSKKEDKPEKLSIKDKAKNIDDDNIESRIHKTKFWLDYKDVFNIFPQGLAVPDEKWKISKKFVHGLVKKAVIASILGGVTAATAGSLAIIVPLIMVGFAVGLQTGKSVVHVYKHGLVLTDGDKNIQKSQGKLNSRAKYYNNLVYKIKIFADNIIAAAKNGTKGKDFSTLFYSNDGSFKIKEVDKNPFITNRVIHKIFVENILDIEVYNGKRVGQPQPQLQLGGRSEKKEGIRSRLFRQLKEKRQGALKRKTQTPVVNNFTALFDDVSVKKVVRKRDKLKKKIEYSDENERNWTPITNLKNTLKYNRPTYINVPDISFTNGQNIYKFGLNAETSTMTRNKIGGDYESSDYDSEDHDSEKYNSENYNSDEYESYDYDSHEYESDDYDSHEYESDDYDSHEYESDDYESDDYDSDDYDSDEYDSDEYDSDIDNQHGGLFDKKKKRRNNMILAWNGNGLDKFFRKDAGFSLGKSIKNQLKEDDENTITFGSYRLSFFNDRSPGSLVLERLFKNTNVKIDKDAIRESGKKAGHARNILSGKSSEKDNAKSKTKQEKNPSEYYPDVPKPVKGSKTWANKPCTNVSYWKDNRKDCSILVIDLISVLESENYLLGEKSNEEEKWVSSLLDPNSEKTGCLGDKILILCFLLSVTGPPDINVKNYAPDILSFFVTKTLTQFQYKFYHKRVAKNIEMVFTNVANEKASANEKAGAKTLYYHYSNNIKQFLPTNGYDYLSNENYINLFCKIFKIETLVQGNQRKIKLQTCIYIITHYLSCLHPKTPKDEIELKNFRDKFTANIFSESIKETIQNFNKYGLSNLYKHLDNIEKNKKLSDYEKTQKSVPLA